MVWVGMVSFHGVVWYDYFPRYSLMWLLSTAWFGMVISHSTALIGYLLQYGLARLLSMVSFGVVICIIQFGMFTFHITIWCGYF